MTKGKGKGPAIYYSQAPIDSLCSPGVFNAHSNELTPTLVLYLTIAVPIRDTCYAGLYT